MVFAVRNLSVLAYANGFTLWHYKAGKEKLATVSRANFFADAADMLAVGDLIMTSAADGARILCVTMADIETVTTAGLA
jgi:ketopantoate hydroxymethyltransferase